MNITNLPQRPVYPFSAIVGQERLKRALILNAINPRIGGVLIRGEKGTAKSTAVRALTRLLPSIKVVVDCPYSCDPDMPATLCASCQERLAHGPLPTMVRPTRLVELPVSASEDRVVGSLDLEHAITEGQRRFEPGLLAQVNRGVLYVDEVNLLDDHLVDLLLDAAAMGVNTVEREGVSVSHPARFILVGTMNPEEGELRPQLLDRFGLAVEVVGLTDVNDRVAVIERRMAYEADPFGFIQQWHEAEEALSQRIAAARTLLPQVQIDRTDMAVVASLCIEMGVDGHRADLTILETARTHAAWSGRRMLLAEDIRLAAELALPHRMRRQPFGEVKLDEQRMATILEHYSKRAEEIRAQAEVKKKPDLNDDGSNNDEGGDEHGGGSTTVPVGGAGTPETATPANEQATGGTEHQAGDVFRPRRLETTPDRTQRRAPGRRSRSRTTRKQGRYITSRRAARVTDLALDATLREAAIYQRKRRMELMHTIDTPHRRRPKIVIKRSDLRQKVRVRRTRNAVCFVVDASWSMAAEERMQATKAAVLSLLRDAYQRRDQVGLVSFQRDYARVLLPLTNSVELAQRRLQSMPTGGKTPLSRGLLTAFELLERARRRDAEVVPLMVLLTDGQANVSISDLPPQQEAYRIAEMIADRQIQAIVIDTEHPHFDRGLSRRLAEYLRGIYYRLEDLQDDGLVRAVRQQMRT
ncbi:MAG: magnesium chelatase [Chloroflexus sp.]|uniref:putative cobaltochelatase n=1 Tax=Chloroflexus sp. TaxID=1904827 RepID=UPI0021DDE84F|nr:putative cobaltochelatase [Chloroflexus sp.]GIV90389.1 MAG: magnesium chelatase [Chloroflexus sp.]